MAVKNDTTTKNKRGGLRGIIASAISLCVLIALALLLIPGGPGPGIDGIGRWLSGIGSLSGEFYFSQGTNKVFAELTGGMAAAGELGIQALGEGGEELFREQVRLSHPAIDASDGRAIVYDIGGYAVRVIDSGGIISSLETKERIISASINENGWFCVSTRASDGFKSFVTVYSDKGKDRYRIEIASGYVLDARLNRDNKNIAVLSVTDTGGRVSFYSRDKKEPLALYDWGGEVVLAARWLSDGRVVGVTKTAVLIISKGGQGEAVYQFDGRHLGGICVSGGDFLALYLLDYGVGNDGRLVTLDKDGVVLAEIITTDENKAMSLCGGTLAVLWDHGVTLYDSGLNAIEPENEGEKLTGILALSGGKVLAISHGEASVIN